ncbi:MAG TPA: hypothetical protein VGL42_17265 [Opitutaceae bacterium]|jgi:hypothetical protein
MSDTSHSAPRPVSLVTILALFVCLGLVYLALRYTYLRHSEAAVYNIPAENMSKDDAWQATPDSRLQYLHELRAKHEAQLGAYGWVDQKNGVVQIPIDRAMELTVQHYGSQSSPK